jgi:hypothetical protein
MKKKRKEKKRKRKRKEKKRKEKKRNEKKRKIDSCSLKNKNIRLQRTIRKK